MKKISVFLFVFLFPVLSQAYPEFIAKGYTNCVTCHYSPTGGGFPNSYGHATQESTFTDTVKVSALEHLRSTLQKNDVTGYNEVKEKEFQWDLGFDSRFLFLSTPQEEGGGKELAFIPMLIETGGVVAYGPWLTYGTISLKRGGAEQRPDSVFSREHWVEYKLSEDWAVRGGRMTLPFGLRMADHTQYTREDLGFNKWDQSYGIEADHYTENWMMSFAGFVGDLLRDSSDQQQRGFATSITKNFSTRASLGSSFLYSTGTVAGNLKGSLFTRVRLWKKIYTMLEASPYYSWANKTPSSQGGIAGFARLGWFPIESLDLFFEWGGRKIARSYELTKYRYMLGAQWKPIPWVEFIPSAFLEEDVESGRRFGFLAQVHVLY